MLVINKIFQCTLRKKKLYIYKVKKICIPLIGPFYIKYKEMCNSFNA